MTEEEWKFRTVPYVEELPSKKYTLDGDQPSSIKRRKLPTRFYWRQIEIDGVVQWVLSRKKRNETNSASG